MAKRAREAGFTLVEVLVAIAILGLLMVGLSQATRLGLAAWNRQSDLLGPKSDLEAVDRTLRLLLSKAEPNGKNSADEFLGEPDRIEFTGMLPSSFALRDRRARIVLQIARSEFVLEWTSRLIDSETGRRISGSAPLLDGIVGVRFAYWGSQRPEEAPEWHSRWIGARAPELVRLRFDFQAGRPRDWPDIVIATMLEAEAS